MKRKQSNYTVRKLADGNFGLYFRGRLAEHGIFATRKTANKYKMIAEVEARRRAHASINAR